MRAGICFSADVWILMVTCLGLGVTVFWLLVHDELYHYGNPCLKRIDTLPSSVSFPLTLDVLLFKKKKINFTIFLYPCYSPLFSCPYARCIDPLIVYFFNGAVLYLTVISICYVLILGRCLFMVVLWTWWSLGHQENCAFMYKRI